MNSKWKREKVQAYQKAKMAKIDYDVLHASGLALGMQTCATCEALVGCKLPKTHYGMTCKKYSRSSRFDERREDFEVQAVLDQLG